MKRSEMFYHLLIVPLRKEAVLVHQLVFQYYLSGLDLMPFYSCYRWGHYTLFRIELVSLDPAPFAGPDIASIICWTHHDIKLLGKILGHVSSFLANSEPSPTRNQEVQSGVEEPTLKQGQPDHSTIPVISSSEVCTDSESVDGEDLTTARGLQEYKRWRTRRPKKTTQSLRRKPYGNDGTTRNLRHDYCTMHGQRIIQDEKLVRDTLLKSCGCTRKCMTQINASQIMLLRSGYCALGSRAAQNDYLKLLARDFKKLSDHDERLQPHLSLPNSPPIEVCQEAFCLVYERFGPEIISSRKQRQEPSFDLCAKFFSDIMTLCSRVSRDKLGRPIYHLLYGTEWKKMYEDRFVPWVAKHYPGADIPSESEFYAVHENLYYPFHNLHLPGEDKFGRCTDCGELNTMIWFAEKPEKNKSAMEARDLHDKMTTLEQGIPSYHPPKKLFDRKSKLEVNFGGGINFSISQENHIKYFFVYFSHFTKDANLVLTQLFFMIWAQLTSDFAASRSAELRIHVDNTAAEKLFSFAGWLLLLLLFKKVFWTFLPVWHTGNEVDSSVFGSVKDKCKVSDIVCLFDIFKVAKEGLTKPNQLIYLRSVLDFRSSFNLTCSEFNELSKARAAQNRCFDRHSCCGVVEASSLPPLNLIEAADQRITVADEAYKSMLAAYDGGRLHMKLIPSSTKAFKNIRTNDQSENQSADPECLPVSATVRESQLEKVVEGMHASMLALASKQEALQQEFESREHEFERKLTEQKKILEARVSEEEQKRRVLAHKYHKLKEAFSQSENSTPASKSTPANSHPAPASIATSNLPNEGPITAKRKVISRPDLRQDKIPFLIPGGFRLPPAVRGIIASYEDHNRGRVVPVEYVYITIVGWRERFAYKKICHIKFEQYVLDEDVPRELEAEEVELGTDDESDGEQQQQADAAPIVEYDPDAPIGPSPQELVKLARQGLSSWTLAKILLHRLRKVLGRLWRALCAAPPELTAVPLTALLCLCVWKVLGV
eukprot:g22662.t1